MSTVATSVRRPVLVVVALLLALWLCADCNWNPYEREEDQNGQH